MCIFSISKSGVYMFIFNVLMYGGYEMMFVKVIINVVVVEIENGEEEML